MAKVDVDIVKMVMERNEIDVRTLSKVLEDIQHVLKEEEMAKDDKPPPVKKQFVMLVSDPQFDQQLIYQLNPLVSYLQPHSAS